MGRVLCMYERAGVRDAPRPRPASQTRAVADLGNERGSAVDVICVWVALAFVLYAKFVKWWVQSWSDGQKVIFSVG